MDETFLDPNYNPDEDKELETLVAPTSPDQFYHEIDTILSQIQNSIDTLNAVTRRATRDTTATTEQEQRIEQALADIRKQELVDKKKQMRLEKFKKRKRESQEKKEKLASRDINELKKELADKELPTTNRLAPKDKVFRHGQEVHEPKFLKIDDVIITPSKKKYRVIVTKSTTSGFKKIRLCDVDGCFKIKVGLHPAEKIYTCHRHGQED